MGTGKSTVGQALAQRLNMSFIDADVEIVRREGRSIPDIFEADGEARFREIERALLLELAGRSDCVIATGGGMVVNAENRRILLDNCLCVGLTAPPDVILERVGGEAAAQSRPMLRSDDVRARIAELLITRAPAYAELHYHVDTAGRTPAQVAEMITGFAQAEQMRIPVAIANSANYDIVIGDGMLEQLGHLLRDRGWSSPAAIVSDKLAGSYFAGTVALALKAAGVQSFVFTIPYGEQHKTLASVEMMYRAFSAHGMDRSSPVIALGGGVLGDTAGFAAATYLRGVPFVQAPTTLLAMADSSIGGKVGVDTQFGKNLVGAFKQPDLVVMDTRCLLTLPIIELRCGYAEIIKAALIKGGDDYALVRPLADSPMRDADEIASVGEDGWVDGVMMAALVNAIHLKREVVEADPLEKGRRALLNLGHTFGHGIEAFSEMQLKHGYAVSLGMVCAFKLSQAMGLCDAAFVSEAVGILRGVGLPTHVRDVAHLLPPFDVDAIWRIMQSDKKKKSGKLRFIVIRSPGDVFVSGDVDEATAKEALRSVGD
jgi:shikimate kinase / 3-dehydroquinate synthase